MEWKRLYPLDFGCYSFVAMDEPPVWTLQASSLIFVLFLFIIEFAVLLSIFWAVLAVILSDSFP